MQRTTLTQLRAAARFLAPWLVRHRWRLAAGFACLAGVNLLQLIIPHLTRRAVDGLEGGLIDGRGLGRLALAIIGLALGIACCRFGWRYLVVGFSRILERDLRERFFAHLLTLDRNFFHRRTVGDIMALATNDLAAVQLACGMGLIAAADALFMTCATLIFMAWIHPGLTAIAIAPLPVLAVATLLLARRIHRRFRTVQERFARITEFVRSTLTTVRLVQAYTQEAAQAAHLDRLSRAYVHDNLELARAQGILFPFSGLVANACLLLVVFFGGRLVIGGAISIGDFVAFMSYLFMLVWPMMAIGWVTNLFQRGVTALDRLQTVLEARPILTDPPGPHPHLPSAGPPTIAVRHLTFPHSHADTATLSECTVTFPPGITGIVGPTGSGKTTLCQILVRLLPVPDETVFFDDIDVNRLPLAAVRSRIAYVPQEGLLFSGTIADNIRFGASEADQEKVEEAARLALIHDDIIAMPDGYQTEIGERGVKLSGGQRQRIALARAFILDRPVLVIDDGLSAVDTETEAAIVKNLERFSRGRTTIIVSHRLAPLAHADRIVVLDGGRVAGEGRHAELLAGNAYYRTIFEHQQAPEES